nr:transposase (putative), gypsy type [Tanacetum cinerariifolium]
MVVFLQCTFFAIFTLPPPFLLPTGWITIKKRCKKKDKTVLICNTKPFDSLKGWGDRLVWVNSSVTPIAMRWFDEKDFPQDSSVNGFNSDMTLETLLNENPARIKKYPKEFLVLIGLSCIDELQNYVKVVNAFDITYGEEKLEENERPLLEESTLKGKKATTLFSSGKAPASVSSIVPPIHFVVATKVRHNAVLNDGNKVGQNAVQNPGIQNVENMNGLSIVSEIANQYGNGNIVTAPAEGNGNGINGNLIRCYNCRGEGYYASNCTVKLRKQDDAYLQQQLQIAQEEEAGI